MLGGLFHIHLRKRIQGEPGTEPFPSERPFKRVMDRLIYVVSIVGPLTTAPQLYDIWILKNASGVSAFSWSAFAGMNVFWLTYAVMHKEKPLIITHILWLLFNIAIAVGAFLYG